MRKVWRYNVEHFVRLPTVVEDSLSPQLVVIPLHMHPAKASSPLSSSRVYRFDAKGRLIKGKALSVPAADRGWHLPNLARGVLFISLVSLVRPLFEGGVYYFRQYDSAMYTASSPSNCVDKQVRKSNFWLRNTKQQLACRLFAEIRYVLPLNLYGVSFFSCVSSAGGAASSQYVFRPQARVGAVQRVCADYQELHPNLHRH